MFYVNNETIGIGVDIENIGRFQGLTVEKDTSLLDKIFTGRELDYCFASGNPAQHLAARYAGKEAIIKALSTLGSPGLNYREIEIINDDRGIPYASVSKKGIDDLKILISLSHSQEDAIAFTIVTRGAGTR